MTTKAIPSDHPHRTNQRSNAQVEKLQIVAENFNCHGFAQSSEYVVDRLKQCDILCLQETWLWPHETNVISTSIRNHPSVIESTHEYTVVSKSGMENKENDYAGRGYGGVAVIARNCTKYSIKEITAASERIASIGLYDTNDKLIQVICSAYFPYYDGDKSRIAQYIETIDALQAIIDTYASQAHIKLLGDFNTQLPTSAKLSKNWHKQKGFNIYSALLYDFLTYNDYTPGDLLFKQKTKYTYFNHKRRIYTWIDHIIFHKNESRDVSACAVVQEEPNNVSDHLPIRIIFQLALTPCADLPKVNKIHHLQPNWSNSS